MIDETDSAGFIVDAAKLRLHQIKRDRLLKSYDGITFFALDTSIITLFTNPGSNQYGRTFRYDSETDATALSLALAEYIFFELSEFPVFQFVPHARETGAIFDIISSQAASLEERTINSFSELLKISTSRELNFLQDNYEDELTEYREELLSGDKSLEEKDAFFQSKLTELLALVLPNKRSSSEKSGGRIGIQKQYRRFLKLFAEQKILDSFDLGELLDASDDGEVLAKAFLDEGSIADWAKTSERKQSWLREFSQHKFSRRSANLENDAEALAELEGLNERLALLNAQVVLLTGDPLIHASLSRARRNSNLTKVLHPLAFVFEAISWQADPDRSDANTRRFSNWLDGLLTTYTGGKQRFINELEALASEKPESISELISTLGKLSNNGENPFDSVLETWTDFKKPILALELIYRNDEKDGEDLVFSAIQRLSDLTQQKEITRQVRELEKAARSQLDQRWDDILIAFTTAGIEILFAFRGDRRRLQRPRNPPLIRFDGFPTATKLIRNLSETHDLATLRELIEVRLDKLSQDTHARELGNTDLGYLTCLVWGALCASEGKWAVTRGLASRAVRIAQSADVISRKGVEISGREAYFLLAVSQRLTISIDRQSPSSEASSLNKAMSDLDSATENLQRAQSALTSEVEGSKEQDRSKKTVRGLRFRVEELAIEVTRANLNFWFGAGDVEFTRHVLHQNMELLARMLEEYKLLSNMRVESEVNGLSDKLHSTRVMIINLCVNVLQCVHICFRVGDAEWARQLVLEAKVPDILDETLSDETLQEEWDFHRTLLIDAYDCFAKQLSKSVSKELAQKCNQTFLRANDETLHVMPYDERRFLDLGKLIGELA